MKHIFMNNPDMPLPISPVVREDQEFIQGLAGYYLLATAQIVVLGNSF